MIRYPLEFRYSAAASQDATWSTNAPEGRSATCAVPPEFEGPGGGYSPEDFFGLALLNCFVGTFKVIAEKSRVSFESLAVSGGLTVDRDDQGRPCMTEFRIEARIWGGPLGDEARLRRIFEKTTQSCIVANSVKTRVTFSLEMNAAN